MSSGISPPINVSKLSEINLVYAKWGICTSSSIMMDKRVIPLPYIPSISIYPTAQKIDIASYTNQGSFSIRWTRLLSMSVMNTVSLWLGVQAVVHASKRISSWRK